jgi:RNA polymerase sigma-70 factor (ECF subfamily)
VDDPTATYTAERPRLLRIAGRLLRDPAEAEDVVQQAWLRLHGTNDDVENLPGWLTTVTTRLCLDRLRARTPVPVDEVDVEETAPDPADEVALADTVGIALQVVLDRLSPGERVAFVLHDSFGVDFPTVAEVLGVSPVAARKLASRARAKVAQPAAQDAQPDWAVVDAFMDAARGGDLSRLLELLAPGAVVASDAQAVALGSPASIDSREDVASFFNGSARSALPVFLDGRPAAAWFLHGEAKVAFDFTVRDGRVERIAFRAAPEALAAVVARRDDQPR